MRWASRAKLPRGLPALVRLLARSYAVRSAALYGLALLPSLLLALRGGLVPAWAALLCAAAGVAIVGAGTSYALNPYLRRFGRAAQAWQPGQPFSAQPFRWAHPRLRRLALQFQRAAAGLERHRQQLRAATAAQDLVMQEIHHRVKNNLQVVASLLNLQAGRIRLPEARAEFQAARDRVRALATLHRHLYAHGEVHTIDLREFLVELCGQLFQAMGEAPNERLKLHIEAPELRMSSDQAVPLALIVTEAVSNAVKYAFPAGRRGNITVRLSTDGATAELEVRDDGIGIPAGKAETETGPRDGLGIQLIRGFSRQLGATLEVHEGEGTQYLIRLPLRQERLQSPALPAAKAS